MSNLVGSNRGSALFIAIFLALFSNGIVTVPATASSHASTLKNLDMNEIMFAQGMIPHHQQAIDMSNMSLKNGASDQLMLVTVGSDIYTSSNAGRKFKIFS